MNDALSKNCRKLALVLFKTKFNYYRVSHFSGTEASHIFYRYALLVLVTNCEQPHLWDIIKFRKIIFN